MKIAILQDDLPPYNEGGAGAIAYELAKGFKKNGHHILMITTVQKPNLAGRVLEEGIEIERLFCNYHPRWRAYLSLYNPQIIPTLKKILMEWKPDIVHVHNVHQYISYHSLKVATGSGARVFLTAHDGMLFHYGKPKDSSKVHDLETIKSYGLRYNPLRNYCIQRYLKYVTEVVAVSNALREALNNNNISCDVVIHNGIAAEKWSETPTTIETFKKEYNLGKRVILFGGRLSGLKGADKILEALAIIIHKYIPDTQLLIIGKKDLYGEKMQNWAEKKDLKKHLIFTGWIYGHTLRQAYHSSSVVAVPSLYLDPFPTVNLEAMACKKPVIATCFGGSAEAVIDEITGYIINPLHISTLAEKLAELLQNNEKNRRFGLAGYKRVIEEFTLEKQIKNYENMFIDVLNKS